MRPRSIVLFERLYGLDIVLAIGSAIWTFLRMNEVIPPLPQGTPAAMAQIMPLMIIGMATLSIVVKLLLWFFIARRGAEVAKWIFVILTALALFGIVRAVGDAGHGMMPPVGLGISAVAILLQLVCTWLLFRPDAKPWFAGERRPRDLHDTFS